MVLPLHLHVETQSKINTGSLGCNLIGIKNFLFRKEKKKKPNKLRHSGALGRQENQWFKANLVYTRQPQNKNLTEGSV